MVKSAEAFRTISEASKELGVPQHVLRHWEDVFGQIRPMRRAGGRRYYRPVDLDLLRGVRVLLYEERYTTKGVQKIFKENGAKHITQIGKRAENGISVDGAHDNSRMEPQDQSSVSQDEESASNKLAQTRDGALKVGTLGAGRVGLSSDHAVKLRNLISRLETLQHTLDNNVSSLEALLEIDKDQE